MTIIKSIRKKELKNGLAERGKRGFALLALLIGLLIISVIMMSPQYLGKVQKELESDVSNRIIRDLSIFTELVNRRHVEHMRLRAFVASGTGGSAAAITALWTVPSLTAMLQNATGTHTVSQWGNGYDLSQAPLITSFIIETENLPLGEIIPSAIRITLTLRTNRAMYREPFKKMRSFLLHGGNMAILEFDESTKKEVRLLVTVGKNAEVNRPVTVF